MIALHAHLAGDILVFVNSEKVLGFSHADIVQLFQAIPVGASTDLVLSKYYHLPPELAQPARHSHSLTPQLVFAALPDPLLLPSHNQTLAAAAAPPATQPFAPSPSPSPQPQPLPMAPTEANGGPPGVPPSERPAPLDEQQVQQQPIDLRAFQLLEVRLVKGSSGFGFTVARNSRAVHYVHHISVENAAPEQLAGLQQIRVGDIIYAVEGANVLYASHAEVVALFKGFRPHCPVSIVVLRPRLPNEPLRSQSTGARVFLFN